MITSWELVGERPGSAGFLAITTRTYVLPDGNRAEWDIVGADRAVAVLAITEDDEVVLARQFRPGPAGVLNELPGGLVEPHEDVVAAGARELLEETGYVGEAEPAGSCWMSASARTRRYVIVVRNARRVADPTPEAGEFCEAVTLPLEAFRRHLRSGELTDVDLGYLALDHLGLLGL